MRLRRAHLVIALVVVTAFTACTLNPQPLPPMDRANEASFGDSGVGSFVDAATAMPSTDTMKSSDAAAQNSGATDGAPPTAPEGDAGASDAGDGGDADAGAS
jgi:hypothetical protein